jgi:hypothetical protein
MKWSIEDELYSLENNHFVLHDSQGFEPGERDNFDKVKAFLEWRAKEPNKGSASCSVVRAYYV